MFNLIGYAALLFGTMYYNLCLKEVECRTLIRYACILTVIGSALNLVFVNRLNVKVGIPDTLFIMSSDIVLGTFSMAYNTMPPMVLFAKITPAAIEASCFAMLTGVLNLSNGVLSPTIGSAINSMFVGVSKDNLTNFSTLCWISFISSLLPFLLLKLIPLKDQIRKLQNDREK